MAAAMAVSGCGGAGPAEPEGRTVALVMKTRNNPFFIEMEKGAREAAGRLGLRLLVSAAEDDADIERQFEILETYLVRRVGAIAVTPCGSKAVVPFVCRANRAGVPVLAVDTRIDAPTLAQLGGRIESFIGSDNLNGGKLAGDHLARLLGGRGEVAVIEGLAGHETGDARRDGFLAGVGAHPGIRVVASQTGEWDQDKAYNVAQNILLAHPAVRGIFACNDRMALGAVQFIKKDPRFAATVKVVGFDASAEARREIEAGGPLVASVAQFPAEMGRLAVENALALIAGRGPLPREIPTKVELVTR
jgi:ribose transport system substrate-binding protein